MTGYILPTSPSNGDVYPQNPLPGQIQFKYDSTTGAWLVNKEINHRFLSPSTPQGRLTLVSNTPILPVSTKTSSSTIFYTPYNGNEVRLYNTSDSVWERHLLTEVSTTVSGWSDTIPRDLFLFHNGTSLAIEQLPWLDYASRTTSLSRQDGILVKPGEPNKLYIGCAYAVSDVVSIDQEISVTNNKVVQFGILNAYNRVIGTGRNADASNLAIGTTEVTVYAGLVRSILDPQLSNLAIVSGSVWGFSNAVNHLVSHLRENPINLSSSGQIAVTISSARTDHYASATLTGHRYNPGLWQLRQWAYVTNATMTNSGSRLVYQVEY